MIILQARLINGHLVNGEGDKKRLGEGSTSTQMGLLGTMVKNKLAPTTSIAFDFLNKKVTPFYGDEIWTNQYGEPLMINNPEASYSPIFYETIEELYKEHPSSFASFLTFLAFIGEGLQTYNPEEQKKIRDEYEMKEKRERFEQLQNPDVRQQYMDQRKKELEERMN